MVNKNGEKDDEFEYDIDKAVEVVWEHIPPELKNKYEFEDIQKFLEIEAHYLKSVGIILKAGEELPVHDYPVETDWPELRKYIVANAIKNNIFLTYDELDEILDAETIYYDMNGRLGDAGEFLN